MSLPCRFFWSQPLFYDKWTLTVSSKHFLPLQRGSGLLKVPDFSHVLCQQTKQQRQKFIPFKKVIQRGCCCTLQQRANCDVFGGNEEVPFEKSSMKRQIYGSSNSTPALPDTATQTISHLHISNFVIYNECLYMLNATPSPQLVLYDTAYFGNDPTPSTYWSVSPMPILRNI